MRFKTEGIVINYIKHRETSIITRIYTSRFGLQHYIVNGVRKPKARHSLSLFQPMTILDLVVYHKGEGGLNRIYEIQCPKPFETIAFDVKKSSISLFLTEMLSFSLHEEEENPELFVFIKDSISKFDRLKENYLNFHLHFLLKLTRYLGFGLEQPQSLLIETLDSKAPDGFVASDVERIGELLYSEDFTGVIITNDERRRILEMIISYYTIHLEIEKEIRSLKVLRSVFE